MDITIDRFEGDRAVLVFPDNQKISIDKSELPANIKEGDVLSVRFLTDEEGTKGKEDQAKAILNEILNTSGNEAA